MGLFDGYKEASLIKDILVETEQMNRTVYFSNLFYIDENENKQEILYIKTNGLYTSYDSIIVNVNDVEIKLVNSGLPIVTMVYLRLQRLKADWCNTSK